MKIFEFACGIPHCWVGVGGSGCGCSLSGFALSYGKGFGGDCLATFVVLDSIMLFLIVGWGGFVGLGDSFSVFGLFCIFWS